jgi:aspartyl-tRNA(Asn)/glutamyl-tRNA(Gln) amidotransferase subunit A
MTTANSQSTFTIGLPEEFFLEGLDLKIQSRIQNIVKKLSKNHSFKKISLPLTKYAISVYYMTMSVEVASNLERIDGIRYASQKQNIEERNQKINSFVSYLKS